MCGEPILKEHIFPLDEVIKSLSFLIKTVKWCQTGEFKPPLQNQPLNAVSMPSRCNAGGEFQAHWDMHDLGQCAQDRLQLAQMMEPRQAYNPKCAIRIARVRLGNTLEHQSSISYARLVPLSANAVRQPVVPNLQTSLSNVTALAVGLSKV